MFRIRMIPLLLVSDIILFGCSDPKGDVKSADTPTTGATTAIAAPECTVDHAASGACTNVLPRGWDDAQSGLSDEAFVKWLTHDDRVWKVAGYKPVKRKFKSACTEGQPKQFIRATGDTRRMSKDVSSWENGATVLMSEIVPSGSGKCADDIYNVSGKRSDRQFFLLFTVAVAAQPKPNGDLVLGTWQILSFDVKNPKDSRELASSGTYVKCGIDHDPPHISAVGRFDSCEYKKKYYGFAHDHGMTAERVFEMVDSIQSQEVPQRAAVTGATPDTAMLSLEKLARMQDGPEDPAWTTCALACCTAEDPTKHTTPALLRPTSPTIRRASTATKLALARPVSSSN